MLVYVTQFYQAPNCFDGRLNGSEIEIDAGGTCVRIPLSQVQPPEVVWADSFEIAPGQYNAVAYIENRNTIAATPELAYTFTFFHDGQVVGERTGVTVLPPNSSYPVFEGRIFPEGQTISDTTLTLTPATMWLPATNDSRQFRTSDIDLQNVDDRPRLAVTLENTALLPANDVEVVATIFNDLGQAVTASETFISSFPARSSQDIQFTWPQSIAKTVRSCSIPTDVVLGIDVSGSMNNDSENPPQPLTDALTAAQAFIGTLNELDQVGVVTFATAATLTQPLTAGHAAAAQLVSALSIAPADETGFTNTSAALAQAATELRSDRANNNARRAFVLLTDGLPTAQGDTDAVAAAIASAQALVASGADVYAIGLGENVDQAFLAHWRAIQPMPTWRQRGLIWMKYMPKSRRHCVKSVRPRLKSSPKPRQTLHRSANPGIIATCSKSRHYFEALTAGCCLGH